MEYRFPGHSPPRLFGASPCQDLVASCRRSLAPRYPARLRVICTGLHNIALLCSDFESAPTYLRALTIRYDYVLCLMHQYLVDMLSRCFRMTSFVSMEARLTLLVAT